MSRPLDRILALEAVRVTEAAAMRAFKLVGRGDEHAADQAAVEGMRWAFNLLPIDGTVSSSAKASAMKRPCCSSARRWAPAV